MDKVFAKGFTEEVKENGTIVGAVASTGSLDREGEILDTAGWELENFKKAPILLWSHRAMDPPIGKITKIWKSIKEDRLKFDAEFAEEENPFAKVIADLMRKKFLTKFSVGFIPKERDGERYLKQELLEISVVNIPANPEAGLTKEYKTLEGMVEEMEEKKLEDFWEEKQVTKTEVQTVIVSKKTFKTLEAAKKWITDHDFNAGKVDDTEESWRFRQFSPGKCQENSFRTITLRAGVKAVICRPKKDVSEDFRSKVRNLRDSIKDTLPALDEVLKESKPHTGGEKGKVETSKTDAIRVLKKVDKLVEDALRKFK